MFFRASADPFESPSLIASSSPTNNITSSYTYPTAITAVNNTINYSANTNTSLNTTPSPFTSHEHRSAVGSSNSIIVGQQRRAVSPAAPSATYNSSGSDPFYQNNNSYPAIGAGEVNLAPRGARSASRKIKNATTPVKQQHPSHSLHLHQSPTSPFGPTVPSSTTAGAAGVAISTSSSATTPPPQLSSFPAAGGMATRFQQHQQSLMQKLQHYGPPATSAQNAGSSPQGPGPGPPHLHHSAFSAYQGPPGSPAGYPNYTSHGLPHSHAGHPSQSGPPPGGTGNGGPGHLQTGPSPGIHHSGGTGGPGNGSAPPGAFGPPGGAQGSGQTRFGAPSSHHMGGGNGGAGSAGQGQMNGNHHHSHSQAVSHFHGQHNGSSGNQQNSLNMGGQSNESGLNGQSAPQQTDLNNSTSAHWQQQIHYANIARQSTSAHHHARAAHLQQRGMTTSANVPIGDPARHPSMSIGRPHKDSKDKDKDGHSRSDSLVADDARPLSVAAIRKGGAVTRSSDQPAPINTAAHIEAEREKTGHAWTTIDMGGMHLRNLSMELFRYSFLTTLYVPHNNLTSLPAGLSSLTHLVLLDASGNKLNSVPPELGMLTNLRELLLFDNQLINLPSELGTLFQLDLLGIEGNPLPDNLRTLVEKEGTPGLVAYLRDSCPVPLPPADREWISVEADAFPTAADANTPEPETFSVFCYNILCEKAATPQMYGYTPSWALSWEYRKELILQEILGYSADIICLQEVDGQQYEDFFLPNLSSNGYEGIYWPRTKARTMTAEEKKHVDGNATFYKPTTFSLVEQQLVEFNQIAMRRPDFKKTEDMFNRVMTKDNIAVLALLEHKDSGARLICANTHVYWDHEFRDVKLVQVAMLMDELTKTANHFARLPPKHPSTLGKGFEKAPVYSEGNKIPMVVCGDFNSLPNSGVYEFMTNGTVAKDHEDFMSHVYGTYTSEGLGHRFALKSAYSHLDNGGQAVETGVGPIITNYTPGFKGCIDHIWHTTNSLSVTGLLGEVDPAYLSKVVGFPNAHFASDHISILSEFKIKPQHTTAERQTEKAQFRLGGGFGR